MGSGCGKVTRSADVVEHYVTAVILRELEHSAEAISGVVRRANKPLLSMSGLDAKREQLLALNRDDLITDEELRTELAKLQEKRKELQSLTATTDLRDRVVASFNTADPVGWWDSLKVEQQKHVLAIAIDTVTIGHLNGRGKGKGLTQAEHEQYLTVNFHGEAAAVA